MKLGLTLISVIFLAALFAPALAGHDPAAMSLAQRLEGPSISHPFGRDENGADVFARVLYGARISIGVSLAVVIAGGLTGLLLGSWAGYRGGIADQSLMRVVDMFYAFPSFLLALSLVAMLGPGVQNLILALVLTSWTGFTRLTRAEVLHLKEQEFVQSARAAGAGGWRILITHIWPNLAGLLIVHATSVMAATIIAEAGLSFLGLGVAADVPTWGGLLNSGRRVLSEAPHLSLAPGLAILLLVLGFNLLGDGLRDSLDPRRVKHKN